MFFIIEFQKTNDETVPYLIYTAPTREEADSKWHTVLSYAAVSTVPVHSASILNDMGDLVAHKTYTHEVEVTEDGTD